VRRYLPKSTDFDVVDDQTIKHIEIDLNNRLRQVQGFKSPNEVMQIHLRRLGFALHGRMVAAE
jgi:IS30 family transposase